MTNTLNERCKLCYGTGRYGENGEETCPYCTNAQTPTKTVDTPSEPSMSGRTESTVNTPDTEWEQDGFIYELKNRIKWDYSYYVSREQSANGYWKRVDSLEQIPSHAISTHRTHPIENPDNLFLYKTYMYISSRDTYWKERVEAYNELILAVGNKHPNETRHQTALRYIKNAEEPQGEAQEAHAQQLIRDDNN